MKVIDLLVELNNFNNGKTANLPKKIKMYGNIYELKKDGYDNHYYYDGNLYTLIKDLDDTCDLNHEIEIIEEDKKIEKLPYYSLEKIQKAKNREEHIEKRIQLLEKRIDDYHNKINEIIDKLKEMEENK